MFGIKKENKNIQPVPDLKITTIPGEFYGGADPMIRFKQVEQTVDMEKFGPKNALPAHEKAAYDKATAKGGFFARSGFWVIGGMILFVLFAGGAGLYYWLTTKTKSPVAVPVGFVTTTIIQQTTELEPNNPPETTATGTASTTEPIATPEYDFTLPSKLLALTADIDADGVSDEAEELFGGDPGNPDSDADGYTDGHELFYLYNPNGFEPKSLIDSGFVKRFVGEYFGQSFYYPEKMVVGLVDREGRQVLVSGITGENIEVRVFDKDSNVSLADWFTQKVPPSETISDYGNFTSRFGASGLKRNDGLVYFFETLVKVFAVIYHAGESNAVSYKTAIDVMARSFSISTTTLMIPESAPKDATRPPIVIEEPTTTVTGESPTEAPPTDTAEENLSE